MSSCWSGGGRAYGFDLEIIKSRSASTRISNSSSSPSSTLSESSNSPISISNRKSRTPRKRPNQIYNEAAALLSTVYPNIFSVKNLKSLRKFSNFEDYFPDESSDVLLPLRVIDTAGFLIHQPFPERHNYRIEPKYLRASEKHCLSPGESEIESKSGDINDEYDSSFDAESILEEDIEGGIDSIIGNLSVSTEKIDEPDGATKDGVSNGLELKMRSGIIRPLKRADEANWWSFSTVNVSEISPGLHKASNTAADKKKKPLPPKAAKPSASESKTTATPKGRCRIPSAKSGLLLKLNYDSVMEAWSGHGSPFSDGMAISNPPENDVSARLAEIDLFPNDEAERGTSLWRYKEKRSPCLVSKKIRYQVRKAGADQRPRMKGRFASSQNSS